MSQRREDVATAFFLAAAGPAIWGYGLYVVTLGRPIPESVPVCDLPVQTAKDLRGLNQKFLDSTQWINKNLDRVSVLSPVEAPPHPLDQSSLKFQAERVSAILATMETHRRFRFISDDVKGYARTFNQAFGCRWT